MSRFGSGRIRGATDQIPLTGFFIFLASEGPTITHPFPTVDAAIELHIMPPDSKCRATRKCAPIDPNQTCVSRVAVLILSSTQRNRDDGRGLCDSVVDQALSGAHADNIRPVRDTQILRDEVLDAAQVHRKLVITAAMSSL